MQILTCSAAPAEAFTAAAFTVALTNEELAGADQYTLTVRMPEAVAFPAVEGAQIARVTSNLYRVADGQAAVASILAVDENQEAASLTGLTFRTDALGTFVLTWVAEYVQIEEEKAPEAAEYAYTFDETGAAALSAILTVTSAVILIICLKISKGKIRV